MITQRIVRFISSFWIGITALVLHGCGRASWCWWLAPITAVIGYCSSWEVILRQKRKLVTAWTIFGIATLIRSSWLLSHPFQYIYAVWIIASLALSFPYALLSLWVVKCQHRTFSWALCVAICFALLEWSYTIIPCGYAFESAALTLSWHEVPLQTASIFGAMGLSCIVFLTNILLFMATQGQRAYLLPAAITALFPYAVGGALFLYNTAGQQTFDLHTPHIRAALCQMEEPPDVFSSHLHPEQLHEQEWLKILSLISPLQPGDVDVIVLPEGAVPYSAHAPLFNAQHLPQEWPSSSERSYLSSLDLCHLIASTKKAAVIIGLEGHTINKEGKLVTYNSCYSVQPHPGRANRYDKQLLIPFGEYIPCASLRSWLSSYGIHESFSPGNGPVAFPAGEWKISPFICYEETFSTYAVEAAKLNPDLLVSISNDAWFPAVRHEHFELARLRAVEVGKPLLRSCNKGVSAAIDSLGRTVNSRGEITEKVNGYCIASLSLYKAPSLFIPLGPHGVALLLSCVAVIALILRPHKKHMELLQKD